VIKGMTSLSEVTAIRASAQGTKGAKAANFPVCQQERGSLSNCRRFHAEASLPQLNVFLLGRIQSNTLFYALKQRERNLTLGAKTYHEPLIPPTEMELTSKQTKM
jgi:hypothetical protein